MIGRFDKNEILLCDYAKMPNLAKKIIKYNFVEFENHIDCPEKII